MLQAVPAFFVWAMPAAEMMQLFEPRLKCYVYRLLSPWYTLIHKRSMRKNWLKASALFKQGKSKIESSFPFACLSATALGERETRRVCVTAVACKRSWFCPKCRWHVTATHTCMHPTYVALHEVMWHGAWLYGLHRRCLDGSSFTWHQPCNS